MHSRLMHGYSLMEVLVATLVLSAGVIGATGMQLAAWRTMQQSAFHTMALQLATEMAEWLPLLDHSLLEGLAESEAIDENAAASHHCYAVHCTAQEWAQFLQRDWKIRMKSALPDAKLHICRDTQPWDSAANAFRWHCTGPEEKAALVIKIGWHDNRTSGAPDLPQVVVSAATR